MTSWSAYLCIITCSFIAGCGGETDSSADLLNEKALQGDSAAQLTLYQFYMEGRPSLGIEVDTAEAVNWLKRSAESNNPLAQSLLSSQYAIGKVVAPSKTKEMEWEKRAAEGGYAFAQFNLGVRYRDGEGVPKNYKKAVYWFGRGAQQEDCLATVFLARMYEQGLGVQIDHKAAFRLYRKLTEQNCGSMGMSDLARCYRSGLGVEKNLVKAYMWNNIASSQGDDDARISLRELERIMTPTAIQQAQSMSENWQP